MKQEWGGPVLEILISSSRVERVLVRSECSTEEDAALLTWEQIRPFIESLDEYLGDTAIHGATTRFR